MEATHKPGNLPCNDVRELLSDLIDVRRGEIPHPDGTRLSEPGMRAAVELHVAACSACREELSILEEVGSAFSDFSVGEAPAQQFADYGKIVRTRMAINKPGVISGAYALRANHAQVAEFAPKRSWRVLALAASTLTAACLAFALSSNVFHQNSQIKIAEKGSTKKATRVLTSKTLPQMRVLVPGVAMADGAQAVSQEFIRNPEEPRVLQTLQDDEKRYGYFVFGEKTTGDDKPLLGVYLKTTRDEDRVAGDKIGLMVYYVVPGSPAAAMKLKPGDYIVDINGVAINDGGAKDAVEFFSKIRTEGPGKQVKVQIVRPVGDQHLYMVKDGTLGEYED